MNRLNKKALFSVEKAQLHRATVAKIAEDFNDQHELQQHYHWNTEFMSNEKLKKYLVEMREKDPNFVEAARLIEKYSKPPKTE